MARSTGLPVRAVAALVSGVVILASAEQASARPAPGSTAQMAAESLGDEGLVGSGAASPSKVLQDTVWIADWSFDAPGGGCTDAGWVKWDNRIYNIHDDAEFLHLDDRFGATR